MNTTVLLVWFSTLFLLAWQGFDSWPALPDTLSTKFDLSGHAQGVSTKQNFYLTWYLVIALMNAMIFLIRSITLRSPARFINIPNREYWLATPERRLLCSYRMTTLTMLMFALVNVMLALLFQSVVEFNLTGHTAIPVWLPTVAVPVIVLVIALYMRKTFTLPGNYQ